MLAFWRSTRACSTVSLSRSRHVAHTGAPSHISFLSAATCLDNVHGLILEVSGAEDSAESWLGLRVLVNDSDAANYLIDVVILIVQVIGIPLGRVHGAGEYELVRNERATAKLGLHTADGVVLHP